VSSPNSGLKYHTLMVSLSHEDLPYIVRDFQFGSRYKLSSFASQYSTEGKIKEPNLALEAGQGLLGAASSYARGDMSGVFQSVTGFVRTATGGKSAQERARQTKTSPADVVRRLPFLFTQLA
jgi:hypothetical protein